MSMESSDVGRLKVRLENAIEYLEMCARLKAKHPEADLAWDAPVIERRYTVMDVLREALAFFARQESGK